MTDEHGLKAMKELGETELRRLEERVALDVLRIDQSIQAVSARLGEEIRSGDIQLMLHIQAQKETLTANKQAVDAALESLDKQTQQADTARRDAARAIQLAQDKFEGTVGARFAAVNEFRKALDDLGKEMATRRELVSIDSKYADAIGEVQKAIGDLRSRIDIGPAGLQSLQRTVDLSGGRQIGVDLTSSKLVGYLVAAVAFIGLIIAFANYASSH